MTLREKLLGGRLRSWMVGLMLVGAIFTGVACEGEVSGDGGGDGVEGEADVDLEEGGEGGEGEDE